MAFSTGEKIGAALLVGSLVIVGLLVVFILVGLDGIWAVFNGAADLVFELANSLREALFGVA